MTTVTVTMKASTERRIANAKIGDHQLFSVTLGYEGNIPDFSGTLYAIDEENAEIVCSHEATNRGWPREHIISHVTKLQ